MIYDYGNKPYVEEIVRIAKGRISQGDKIARKKAKCIEQGKVYSYTNHFETERIGAALERVGEELLGVKMSREYYITGDEAAGDFRYGDHWIEVKANTHKDYILKMNPKKLNEGWDVIVGAQHTKFTHQFNFYGWTIHEVLKKHNTPMDFGFGTQYCIKKQDAYKYLANWDTLLPYLNNTMTWEEALEDSQLRAVT